MTAFNVNLMSNLRVSFFGQIKGYLLLQSAVLVSFILFYEIDN